MRVVTVGAGYFSRFHIDGWLRNEDIEFAGLADLDQERANALLAEISARSVPVFSAAQPMFAAIRPDIIDIATPPSAHLDLIRIALRTNARAIICQKPFCGSLEQARLAVEEIKAAGRLVVIHENFRFQPWYRIIRQEIANGRVGDLYQICFRLRPGDGQGPDAYRSRQPYFRSMRRFLIHETAVHWIDTFRFLMGEPGSVLADLRQLNPAIAGEDSGLFVFRYADGRRAMFDGNRLVDHVAENPRLTMGECLIEGSRGVITLDGDGALMFRANGERSWSALGGDYPRHGFGGGCVHALQKHVSDHLIHGTPIENDAGAYLRNIEIEEAIYRAADEARVVELTREERSSRN